MLACFCCYNEDRFQEVVRLGLDVKTRLVLDTGEYDKLGLEGVVKRELRFRKWKEYMLMEVGGGW
jgi:hypothetical protein